MIVGCDAAENYVLRDSQLVKWLDCNMAKSPRIVSFYIFLTGARLNNLLFDNIMELKIPKRKCACGSSFVKILWKLLLLKMSTMS